MRALGFGGLALACTTCLQQWFVRRRGLATGLSEAANTFVGFGLCSQLYAGVVTAYGWERSYIFVGGALLVYSPLAALLLRSRPEDIGMAPDGDTPSSAGGAQRTTSAVAVTGWTLREATRTSALWVVVVGNALMWGIGAGLFFHLVSIVDEFGLPPTLLPSAFYFPWALMRATSLGLGGWLLDHVAPRHVMLFSFALASATFLVFGWAGSAAVLTPARTVLIASSWGFSMGFGKATFAVCPAAFFGRKHLGSIQGLLQTTNVAATAVGPLLVGIAHDVCRAYSPIIFTVAALYACIGCTGALRLRVPARRQQAEDGGDAAAAAVECGVAEEGCSALGASVEAALTPADEDASQVHSPPCPAPAG